MGWTTFEDLTAYHRFAEKEYDKLEKSRKEMWKRRDYLASLIMAYNKYEPYIKYNKECLELRGWKQRKYKREHMKELAFYDVHRNNLKKMIREDNKKISITKWRKELAELEEKYDKTEGTVADLVWNLARTEVLSYNKRELENMLDIESRQRDLEVNKSRKKEVER